jgi:hypothetical protein
VGPVRDISHGDWKVILNTGVQGDFRNENLILLTDSISNDAKVYAHPWGCTKSMAEVFIGSSPKLVGNFKGFIKSFIDQVI